MLDYATSNPAYVSYDPNCGRFISQDPIDLQGGENFYQFAASATGWIGPLGLYTLGEAKNSLRKRGAVRKGGYGSGLFGVGIEEKYSNQQVFDEWYRMEKQDLTWTKELPLCPKRMWNCKGNLWEERREANSQHLGGKWEVRSKETAGGHSNQCVYDANGDIMTRMPAAGTADFGSCPHPPFCATHTTDDYLPWLRAKNLGKTAKEQYYEVRPVLVEP